MNGGCLDVVTNGGWLDVAMNGGWLAVATNGGWLDVATDDGWVDIATDDGWPEGDENLRYFGGGRGGGCVCSVGVLPGTNDWAIEVGADPFTGWSVLASLTLASSGDADG